MAVIDYQVKPCPKCKGVILAKGMPIKVTTPKMIRPLMHRIGIVCIRCGYYKHSLRAWNRRADNGKE